MFYMVLNKYTNLPTPYFLFPVEEGGREATWREEREQEAFNLKMLQLYDSWSVLKV